MSLQKIMVEERRLAILQALAQDADRTVNELILRRFVSARVDDVDRDTLRGDLAWLERAGMLRIDRLDAGTAGELWRATLREDGLAVTRGRIFPGIASPDLG